VKNDIVSFDPFLVAFKSGVINEERNDEPSADREFIESSMGGINSLGQKCRKKLMTRPFICDPSVSIKPGELKANILASHAIAER
jgi:hypothetical protein